MSTVSDLKAVPDTWVFMPYKNPGGVASWAGWYELPDGKYTGFLGTDGKVVEWNEDTEEVKIIHDHSVN